MGVEVPALLTIDEAAKLAGVTSRSVRYWIKEEKLACRDDDGVKKIRRDELAAFLKERQSPPPILQEEAASPQEETSSPSEAVSSPRDAVSSPPEEQPSSVEEAASPMPTGIEKLVDLLVSTQRRNDTLTEQVFQLSGQLGFYQAKMQEYEQRILLLEAPKVSTNAITLAREEIPVDDPVAVVVTTEPLPWWKRLFGAP